MPWVRMEGCLFRMHVQAKAVLGSAEAAASWEGLWKDCS